jgi:hypothetical protein
LDADVANAEDREILDTLADGNEGRAGNDDNLRKWRKRATNCETVGIRDLPEADRANNSTTQQTHAGLKSAPPARGGNYLRR